MGENNSTCGVQRKTQNTLYGHSLRRVMSSRSRNCSTRGIIAVPPPRVPTPIPNASTIARAKLAPPSKRDEHSVRLVKIPDAFAEMWLGPKVETAKASAGYSTPSAGTSWQRELSTRQNIATDSDSGNTTSQWSTLGAFRGALATCDPISAPTTTATPTVTRSLGMNHTARRRPLWRQNPSTGTLGVQGVSLVPCSSNGTGWDSQKVNQTVVHSSTSKWNSLDFGDDGARRDNARTSLSERTFTSSSRSLASMGSSPAAAAFFARAAQKMNLSSPRDGRKRSSPESGEGVVASVGVGFSGVLHRSPPPMPLALLRRIGVREVTGVGKVKVMLRVSHGDAENGVEQMPLSSSFFSVDTRRKQVTLFDPVACGGSSTPQDRRVGVAAPKMFAFDALFTKQDSQVELCASALTDVIHAVINGNDGCLFCYGHARLGKSHTMVGTTDEPGIIPCAISWLFRAISEQKQKTGARFSVRVSAVEVLSHPTPHLRDLLSEHVDDCEQSPGVFLRDEPLLGSQLQNQVELRVPTADKAAFYLDAALAARDIHQGHFLYTLHVYQYSLAGKSGVAGGRSRLHLMDLASCERGKADGGISLSGVGNILLAIFNGQKHLPYRDHKLSQVLRECLSSLTCYAAMIAHVSPFAQHYTDTLSTVQLASRVHRMRRRKIKFGTGSTGSGGSSGEEARFLEAEVDPSSSEQSADTVIYVGPCDDATDGEHPPVYLPSMNSGDNRCAMGKALRGSGAEYRPRSKMSTPEKLPNGRSSKSPVQSSVKSSSPIGKPLIGGSCKSPVRSVKSNSKSGKEHDSQTSSPAKIPTSNGGVSTSDEQWIDGPRISKSKVAEARSLLKKKETWIDGPFQGTTKAATLANGLPTGAAYGFMDNHKKSMIRKWVENQIVQSPRTGSSGNNSNGLRLPAVVPQQPCKEMTVFKTCAEEESINEPTLIVENIAVSKEEEEDDEVGQIPPPLQLLHPPGNEISLDTVKDEYDMDMAQILESQITELEPEEDSEDYDEVDEVVMIEVEDTSEPVPMQDSCLQVTEEDIALCMGKMENPLPEVDQDSIEEHPLRILSEENLTIVSTFADSISVSSEGRQRYSFYEQEDRFQQLARLHEMYKSKLERSSPSTLRSPPFRSPPSRCQSVSLGDVLCGTRCDRTSDASICSEPAFTYGVRICGNCKMNFGMEKGNDAWFSRTNYNFSSLRHPDGASNPNLKDASERMPGNGASLSDYEGEVGNERDSLVSPPPAKQERFSSKPPMRPRLATVGLTERGTWLGIHADAGPPTTRGRSSSSSIPVSHKNATCSPMHLKHSLSKQESPQKPALQKDESVGKLERVDPEHLESRQTAPGTAPVLQYCREDVERLERRWTEVRGGRVKQMMADSSSLKTELSTAKTRILIPADRWNLEHK